MRAFHSALVGQGLNNDGVLSSAGISRLIHDGLAGSHVQTDHSGGAHIADQGNRNLVTGIDIECIGQCVNGDVIDQQSVASAKQHADVLSGNILQNAIQVGGLQSGNIEGQAAVGVHGVGPGLAVEIALVQGQLIVAQIQSGLLGLGRSFGRSFGRSLSCRRFGLSHGQISDPNVVCAGAGHRSHGKINAICRAFMRICIHRNLPGIVLGAVIDGNQPAILNTLFICFLDLFKRNGIDSRGITSSHGCNIGLPGSLADRGLNRTDACSIAIRSLGIEFHRQTICIRTGSIESVRLINNGEAIVHGAITDRGEIDVVRNLSTFYNFNLFGIVGVDIVLKGSIRRIISICLNPAVCTSAGHCLPMCSSLSIGFRKDRRYHGQNHGKHDQCAYESLHISSSFVFWSFRAWNSVMDKCVPTQTLSHNPYSQILYHFPFLNASTNSNIFNFSLINYHPKKPRMPKHPGNMP